MSEKQKEVNRTKLQANKINNNNKEISHSNTSTNKYSNLSKSTNPNLNPKTRPRKSLDRSVLNLLHNSHQEENSKIDQIIKKIEPFLIKTTEKITLLIPYLSSLFKKAKIFYNNLPLDIIYAIMGLLLAFFGGIFYLLIAAGETFYMTGFKNTQEIYYKLKEEFEFIWEANLKDNKIATNKDGKSDVSKLSVAEFSQRKFLLFLKTCKNPDQLMTLIPNLLACFISVFAVLKIKFARIIALGHQIGESLRKPVSYFLVPYLGKVVQKDFHKWISPCIEFICKIIAISLALFIRRIISSVQSSIRGGMIFSRRIFSFLHKKNFFYFSDYNEDGFIDEIFGWFVALCGIYFQLSYMFDLPFPLNFLLFPFLVIEDYLKYFILG